MRHYKILAFTGLMFGIHAFSPAQAETVSPESDTTVILNNLAGTGVTIDFVTAPPVLVFESDTQIGVFTGYSFLFGSALDEGVIMSTGAVTDVAGPNSADDTGTDFNWTTNVDPLFGNVYDLVKLSFNVVPDEDSLIVEYVFGSEEYNEYVGSVAYVDFIRINVNGSSCALTADGGGVGINTINDRATYPPSPKLGVAGASSNPFLYINNDPGLDANETPTTPAYNTEMDGFTKTITCRALVTPGSTVPVIIGIADGGDPEYDSWVFLKASSLRSEPSGDYGDAPDSYLTLKAFGGAVHTIQEGVYMGTMPVGDQDGFVDGVDNSGGNATDDVSDDGVAAFPVLNANTNTSYSIAVNATSINGKGSTIIGWIDFDRDGQFQADEASASLTVAANTYRTNTTLTWPQIGSAGGPDMSVGSTFARIRMVNADEAMTAADFAGAFLSGEVEDYKLEITGDLTPPVVTIDVLPVAVASNRNTYPTTGTCTAGDNDVTVLLAGATPASQSVVCNAGIWSASFNVSAIANGVDVIVVNASQEDAQGNVGNAVQMTSDKTVVGSGSSGSSDFSVLLLMLLPLLYRVRKQLTSL